MFVEFISDDENRCLAIKASEFLKAENSRSEFGSMLMAIDAFAALHDKKLILAWKEYNAIKSWLEKDGMVVVKVHESTRTGRTNLVIDVLHGAHVNNVVVCLDDEGIEIYSYENPDKAKTPKNKTEKQTQQSRRKQ